MDQIVQDEQSVEERSYRKNRRKALILWGVLAIITITVTIACSQGGNGVFDCTGGN